MQKVKQKELHFHILVTCISLYYTFLSAYSFVPINQVDLPQALLYKSPPDSTLPLNPTTPSTPIWASDLFMLGSPIILKNRILSQMALESLNFLITKREKSINN